MAKKKTKTRDRSGWSQEFRTRIRELGPKKFVFEVVAKSGRIQLTSREYTFEKQCREGAAHMLRVLKDMKLPDQTGSNIPGYQEKQPSRTKKKTATLSKGKKTVKKAK